MSKNKLKVDNVDIDRDLEYDDFDMGFGNFEDDRKPVSKPGLAFVKGVGKGLSDADNIRSMIKKNIPTEYGDAYDMLGEVSSGGKDFASTMVKETKPIVGNLANAVEKFLPNNFKATKERLSKIRSWAEDSGDSNSGISKEEQRKLGTNIELGRIFEQQAQVQQLAQVNEKINKKEKEFDRGLGMAQHKDILSVLTKLTNSSVQVAGYTTTVNSAWQRKTLETQFHQLFALQDLLEETKKSNAQVITSLRDITKNSALPDYRKTQKDEAFMDEARKRFSGKIVDASHNFFRRGLTKMKADLGSLVADAGSITSMMSMVGDMNAMQDEIDPKTMSEKLSGLSGNQIGKWILSKSGGRLMKAAKKNPKFISALAKGQNFIKSIKTDGAGLAKEYLGREEEKGEGGLKGFLAQYLNSTFDHQKTNYSLQKYDSKNMYGVSPFTNKVAHSITDVIPGYLARILQEQTMLRTKKDTPLLKFDYRSGKFATSKSIVDSIKESISEKTLSSSSGSAFTEVMAGIEETVELTDEERSEIANILLKKSVDDSSLDPEKMTDVNHWLALVKNRETAEKMAESMKNIMGTDNNKEFYGFNQDPQKKYTANKWIKEVKDLKYQRKDKHAQAQFLVDNGMMDEARAAGLLDNDENLNLNLIDKNTTQLKGSFKGKGRGSDVLTETLEKEKFNYEDNDDGVIENTYKKLKGFATGKPSDKELEYGQRWEQLDDGSWSKVNTSDVNVKDHIKEPGNVLGSISRLPLKNWRYKPGHEDGGTTERLGPMAQDMQKEFGDDVAPDGKSIDLVSANGINMKAIQELNAKIDSTTNSLTKDKGSDKSDILVDELSCLRGIYYNTTQMMNQGAAMINISAEGLKNLAHGLSTQLGKLDLKAAGAAAQQQYDKAKTFVKENTASSMLGKLGDFISNNTGEVIGKGLKTAKSLIKSGYAGAKDIMGFMRKESGDLFDKAKLNAMETFDVYIQGENEPRMISLKIRQGYYMDFLKQTPIRTRKDVRAAVGGITETQSSGEVEFVIHKTELEKAFFVNTHKSAIEKVLKSGINTLTSSVKGVFNNILSPSFKGAAKLMADVKDFAVGLTDVPVDVFLKKDPSKCVMLAKLMRDGVYRDWLDGTVISKPGQIKGAVYDTVKSELCVSLDEYRDGLVDKDGKELGATIASAAGKALGVAVAAGSSIMKWTMNKLANAPGALGKMAKRGSEMMSALASRLGVPSFTLGNFFGTEAVDVLKDIKNILLFQAGLAGEPTLSSGAIKKVAGLTKKAGEFMSSQALSHVKNSFAASGFSKPKEGAFVGPSRPVSVTESKPAGNLLGTMGGLALSGAGSLLSMFGKGKGKGADASTDASKEEADGAKDGKLTRMAAALKSIGNKIGEKKSQGVDAIKRAVTIGKDGKQTTPDGLRVGSWQEREQNSVNKNKEVIKEKSEVKVYATKNIFSMIADVVGGIKKKISDWMSRKGDPAELAEDIADGWDSEGKRGKKGDSSRRRKDRLKRVKTGRRKQGLGRIMGRGGEMLKDGTGLANKASGGLMSKAGSVLSKGASSLGAGAFGAAKFGAKLLPKALGVAGTAYAGYSAYQNIKEGNYGMAALDAGLGVLGAAGTMGGLSAMGATLGGAGALASGALAVLTAPVTLTALAAAGLLYGGYKAYQYLSRKEFNDSEKVRMLEYGLRGGDDEKMRKIYELELYLESVSTTSKESFNIDDKKFEIEKVYSIFDIDKDDNAKTTNFISWFQKRFKPVFSKWKLLVKMVGDSDKIEWLEKASDAKLIDIFNGFKVDKSVFDVSQSPFESMVSNTDSSVMDSFKKEWLIGLKKSVVKNKDTETNAKVNAAGAKLIAPKADSTVPAEPVSNVNTAEPKSNIARNLQLASALPAGYNKNNPTTSQAVGLEEVEDKSYTDGAPGSQEQASKGKSSPGGSGSLNLAPGELFTGSNAAQYLKLATGANIEGLHPSIKKLFLGMVEEYGQITGKKIQVNTAFRSFAEQKHLYDTLGPRKAARPGSSLHEYGLAIDVQTTDNEALDKLGLLRKYGFTRPMGSEPWHLESAGIHDNSIRQRAKKDHSFATQFIESGVGRGGGGLGARGRSGDLKRDDTYAKMIFNAASKPMKDSEAVAGADQSPAAPAPLGSTQSAQAPTGGDGPMAVLAKQAREPANGKVPSAVGSGNMTQTSIDNSTKAANDSTYDKSKAIAEGKGVPGAYNSLPNSKGSGWENNKDLILAAAKMVGVDPALGAAVAAKESSFKPDAQGVNSANGNNVAQGLYQFMPGTWSDMIKKHGSKYGIAPGTSPLDPRANALLGMEYIKESTSKGDGSPHEAYLGHMLGMAGLGRFQGLKDDSYPAKALPGAASNNPNVFFVGGNKNQPMTKAQMKESIHASLTKNLSDFKVPLSLKKSTAAQAATLDSAPQANATSASPTVSQEDVKSISSFSRPPATQASTPMGSMAGNAPVANAPNRAPVVENTNNGMGRFEKISVDQLSEQKTTNTILLSIKDLLVGVIADGKSRASEKLEKPEASKPFIKQTNAPTDTPTSYVQRRRA